MRKQLIIYILLLLTVTAFAQKQPAKAKPKVAPSVAPKPRQMTVNLTESKYTLRTIVNGVDLVRVMQGTYKQKFSILTSDSSYIHPSLNTFDAFGHVVITQGDTLHIYADNLTYDDNTKIAVLTNHVRMVDKDAVLTTDYLTYNTATKIGTYLNGGKLVNKGNVLTSQNGYYYAGSRDAYFRYNVVMTSTDALIKTDTLRYNSGTRITYFYGPTNIYGKKDKDTLYTENGTYNTKTEQAFFGKKNRYSQGTKSLKGDSLFYDKLKGYGKAIKNITFQDTEQKMILKGNLGEYFKADDRAVVTQNPYVIFITEERDTSKVDTTKKIATALPIDNKNINATLKNGLPKVKSTKTPSVNDIPKGIITKANTDSLTKTLKVVMTDTATAKKLLTDKLIDSVKNLAVKNAALLPKNLQAPPGTMPLLNLKNAKSLLNDTARLTKAITTVKDTATCIKRDTMYIGADTLETQVITYKAQKEMQEARRLAGIRDTSKILRKPFVPYKTQPKVIEATVPQLILPTPDFKNRPLFAVAVKPPKAPDTLKKRVVAKVDIKKKPKIDSVLVKAKTDLLNGIKPLADTARVRILSAHHNVHIFKSDLQGKSDSLFYSSSDSIICSFVKPMYWAQGSQLSGDTIYLQLKNKKADNMTVFPSAMVVQIENNDSTHFNQMGGKRLKAYFKDNKISQVIVTGNAETIYFDREKGKVKQMARTISNRITANFKQGQLANVSFVTKDEKHVYPNSKTKDDDKLLKNFIWKPKDRPANKDAVIHPKKPVADADDTKKTAAKPGSKTPAGKAAADKTTAKDSTSKAAPILKPTVLKRDTTAKVDSLKKLPELKLKKDSLKTVIKS